MTKENPLGKQGGFFLSGRRRNAAAKEARCNNGSLSDAGSLSRR